MSLSGARSRRSGAGRWWLRLFWLLIALIVVIGLTLLPHLRNSAELVRMRNAMLLQMPSATYDWTPSTVPPDFLVETAAPLPLYAEAVAREQLKSADGDWATALAIGRHLLPEGRRSGGAIRADLADTYTRITQQGEGYCGDYADSFTGLATAAGLFSRPWAFSFDGFGGHGHIFNEIWDRQRGRWIMLDVFNNFYVTDAEGEPLSAMAFRQRLLSAADSFQLVPVDPLASPGFRIEAKALDYYRRGLPEWYMWWGNNVFEYDRAALVQAFGRLHRVAEQLGGIAAGVHPGLRIVDSEDNRQQREAMENLRLRLITIAGLSVLAGLILVISTVRFASQLFTRRRFTESQ